MLVYVPVYHITHSPGALREQEKMEMTVEFADPPKASVFVDVTLGGEVYAIQQSDLARLGDLARFCLPVIGSGLEVLKPGVP